MSNTKQRLMDATLSVLRDKGIAGLSARLIAGEADVNQALIFYHFQSVEGLVEQACREGTKASVAAYAERFRNVSSLTELLAVGRELHATEEAAGNVAVMAQVMAGAQSSKALAAAGKAALDTWIAEIEPVLSRVLTGTPLAEIADVAGLARAVAASFIGLELYEGVDATGAASAIAALEQLGVLADVVSDLGPVARQALRRRLRASQR